MLLTSCSVPLSLSFRTPQSPEEGREGPHVHITVGKIEGLGRVLLESSEQIPGGIRQSQGSSSGVFKAMEEKLKCHTHTGLDGHVLF